MSRVLDRGDWRILIGGCGLALLLAISPQPAEAQFLGHNFHGDFGLASGSQPAPGLILAPVYIRYDGETLRDAQGNSIAVDPDEQGSIDVNAIAFGGWYVTNWKVLGGNYGFMAFPAFTDNKLQVPVASLTQSTSLGFTDLFVQPANLGWQIKQADFVAGLGLYLPTGRYNGLEAEDNLGMGMWTFELSAGTTVYFDEARTWNLAMLASYETHTKKKDSDVRVGDILNLEGGMGKSFLGGAMNLGLVYYAQWKVTHDDLGELTELTGVEQLPKHRTFGIGPELTVPIATKTKLIALITGRYFWETGARTTLDGSTFVLQAAFPIPSVPL